MSLFKVNKRDAIIPFCLFLFTFIIYIRYLAPTILSGDVAEFAIASYVLGIPHPTGYPLYIWIGKIFTLIPIGDIGFRVNLMSAFFAALTVSVTYLIIKLVMDSKITPIISALTLAFIGVFWEHALFAEVYTFNAFIMSIAILLLFKWVKTHETRVLYILSIILGLSIVSHLSNVFVIPAFFLTVIISDKKILFIRKHIINIVLLFFLGLSLYLWIPIRAAQHPLWNWGNPDSIQKTIWFLTGGGMSIESQLPVLDSMRIFLVNFYANISIVGIIFGILGLYLALKQNTKLFFFLASAFSGYFLAFILFIPSLKLILPIFIIWIIFVGYSIDKIICMVKEININHEVGIGATFVLLILLLPIPMILANEQMVDNIHNAYAVADYGKNALEMVPENSLIITDWDITVFRYFQILYKIRPDVTVIGDVNYSNWINVIDRNINERPVYITSYYNQKKLSEKYRLIPVMVVSASKVTVPWRISGHDWDDVLYKVEINSTLPVIKEPEIPEIQHNLNANFNNKFIFLGYNLDINEVKPGNRILVTYYWKLMKETDVNYTTNTYFLKKQRDGEWNEFRIGVYPTHVYYPTSLWKEGDIIKEEYSLVIPTNADYGKYDIRINKYNWNYGNLKILNLNTSDNEDRLLIGHLYVNQN